MARRRSSTPEQLLIKMLLPLVIALLGYYAFTKIMQNAVTQQIAAIHAIGQQANAAQQLQVEAAQRKKAAAAQAAKAANEKYVQETQLRWEQEQARARAFHASYQESKGCAGRQMLRWWPALTRRIQPSVSLIASGMQG